ncbi:MAG: N-acetyltransferase [Bacteroidota bacterium]
MKFIIRQETATDHQEVFKLTEEAFLTMPYSDHTEHFLVERLRKSSAFIPELSLVAVLEDKIVGHILLTKVMLVNGTEKKEVLSLAPVGVLPAFQSKGIGSKLINKAHELAKDLGYKAVVLIGHEAYYPRFGYVQAHTKGIKFPFEVGKEHCMVIELVENGLNGVKGMVEYPKAFFE